MEKGKNLHQLLLRTQKFTPKVRDSLQSQCFTPPFITLSTRIFTPVGNSLHQQRQYRQYLFPSLGQCMLEGVFSLFLNIKRGYILTIPIWWIRIGKWTQMLSHCQIKLKYDTKNKSGPKLQFHFWMSSLASYSTSIQFLTARSILSSWR